MLFAVTSFPLGWISPIHLQWYDYRWWAVLLGAWAFVVVLGVRSLNGLGPVRKWVAIGVRMAVILLIMLILGGAMFQRAHRDLEVMVIRDASPSTARVGGFPKDSLQESIDSWLMSVARDKRKPRQDRMGVVGFDDDAWVEVLGNEYLELEKRSVRRYRAGSDLGLGIQLALATLKKDAMHRLLLISDGNSNRGDLESALAAASSQGVQIDVMPLKYNVTNEVMVDRVISPQWKKEGEPFTVEVALRSTNPTEVGGRLELRHQGQPVEARQIKLNPGTPDQPGLTVERFRVPPQYDAGVHNFEATFNATDASAKTDTVSDNNTASAFTFVRGKGKVLLIDNAQGEDAGKLRAALLREKIELAPDRKEIKDFPVSLMELQNYEAVVLVNVPRGFSGLNDVQEKILASYVHDLGGGLVMIGGEEAFGAGGWSGSKVEEILPVNMDIPARKVISKGALVLAVHSCEFPNGNFWGEQACIKAVESLSSKDEVGVITFGGGGGGGMGSQWDFPLQERGDGSGAIAAIKKMQVGDMPDFNDMLTVALKGKDGKAGLLKSDARNKHIIIISDGDPSPPGADLIDLCKKNKISISTLTVYPHGTSWAPMTMMAKETGGREYGPLTDNFNQIPQIFIKEASTIRRSLIHEPAGGIDILLGNRATDATPAVPNPPKVFGMVLTSKKDSPNVEMPLYSRSSAGDSDPILAHWQAGLGKATVFTSGVTSKWGSRWLGWQDHDRFWAQVVRGVSRPPMSSDFEVRTTVAGDKGKIIVEAMDKNSGQLNFLSIAGKVLGPDMKPVDVRLVQTGPGTYEGDFAVKEPGAYVAIMNYFSPQGTNGVVVSGASLHTSIEMRDLRSNDPMLTDIARRTGGRVIEPFDVADADLFRRDGLRRTASPLPIWQTLIPWLLGLLLLDVAIRRIAWDWAAIKRASLTAAGVVQRYTMTTRKVETESTLGSLRGVREKVAEERLKGAAPAQSPPMPAGRPDRTAKFEAEAGVDGDISAVVGGATDKPVPPAPKKIQPKGGPSASEAGDHTSGLLAAKRRAREKMEEKE